VPGLGGIQVTVAWVFQIGSYPGPKNGAMLIVNDPTGVNPVAAGADVLVAASPAPGGAQTLNVIGNVPAGRVALGFVEAHTSLV